MPEGQWRRYEDCVVVYVDDDCYGMFERAKKANRAAYLQLRVFGSAVTEASVEEA